MRLLESSGYVCTRAAASFGLWDIIGIGSNDVVLVQVKTRDWPSSAEMEKLCSFPCPANCKRLIHRWRDGRRLPDVKELYGGLADIIEDVVAQQHSNHHQCLCK